MPSRLPIPSIHPRGSRFFINSILVVLACASFAFAQTDVALHQRIDALLEQSLTAPPAPVADDATLVRRIYLDLTGGIPTAAETKAYLEDKSEQKWPLLVDSLLADERFTRHMADQLDVMFMERRADKHVKAAEWRTFLEDAVRTNKPFHRLAAEMLGADGRDPKNRAPAKFYLEREAEPNLLTRDIGRVFFGVDLQCAQCHDHPLIEDYYQADYYGLFGFVSRVSLFADKKQKISYLQEKLDGEVKFKSVFTDEEGRTNPRLPFDVEVREMNAAPGDEYKIKPTKEIGGLPKFSRRVRLAEEVSKGANHAFRRNIANRLWAMMMGRGLVHPVDLHHSDNPPSHPELLALLTHEIAALKFDMRQTLRELALTQAYRRDFHLPEGWASRSQPTLAADQAKWRSELKAVESKLVSFEAEFTDALSAYNESRRLREEAEEAVSKAKADIKAKQAAWHKVNEPHEKAVAALKSLDATLTPLQQALASIEKSGLANDAEVAAAAKQLTIKENALDKKRAGLEAAREKAEKAAAPAKAAWDKTVAAEKPLDAKVEKLASETSQRESAFAAAQATVNLNRRHASQLYLKLEESSRLLEAAEKMAAADEARQSLATIEATWLPLKEKRTPHITRQQALQDSLAQLQAKQQAAKASHQKNVTAFAAATETQQLLAEAIRALSAPVVKTDPETMPVALILQRRVDGLAKQSAELQAAGKASQQAMDSMTAELASMQKELSLIQKELQASSSAWTKVDAERSAAAARLTAASAPLSESIGQLEDIWARRFAMTGLKPLTPEQLCWSILRATGQVEIQQAAAKAALDKKQPLPKNATPKEIAARQQAADEAAYKKLAGNVKTFVQLFAAAAGQPQDDFFATADQALFFRNGSQIRGWVGSGGNSLYGRLAQLKDDAQLADELYIAVLSRQPDDIERQDVVQYLQVDDAERKNAIQEMIWALVTSIEFRFRH